MSATEWLVLAGGVAAMIWINWYFFLAEAGAAEATSGTDGVQEVQIAVHGGYAPAVVRVKRGQPVRLLFDRQENNTCSEEVVISDFGVRKFLPAFQKTAVEFTPEEPGTYEFTCGMGMLRGKVVAE